MKRQISFGSIGKFDNTIRDIRHVTQYQGYDEVKKETIMDRTAKMPVLEAIASEKVHGTNAAVCFSEPDGFWIQSKNNIITPEKDNAGCAFTAEQNKEEWMTIIRILAIEHDIDLNENIITVFFEWSGGNIQDKSACTGMDKRAIIFQHFKVSPLEPQIGDDGKEIQAYWKETALSLTMGPVKGSWVKAEDKNIFNIMSYGIWTFKIDFNAPLLTQNDMIKLVEETIEPDSPLGRHMGVEGNIGEGIVVTIAFKGEVLRFKVKGDKHSKSKVKKLKPVDNEKEQAKIDVATKVAPAWRLEQMYDLANDTINGGQGDIRNMGTFIKMVNQDILKEESDVIAEAGLVPKEVFGKVSSIIRPWYQEQLNKEACLS